MGDDDFDLGRFTAAQDTHGTCDAALAELRAGRKRSHWMWFVFPQLRGLGRSATAREFATRCSRPSWTAASAAPKTPARSACSTSYCH